MLHDFARSLSLSRDQANSPWWELVYREAFPEFSAMTYVGDSPVQRDGVDRLVTTSGGRVYRIDEKVRTVDYPDICLEFWSNEERRAPGWVAKDLGCDFIAYAFVPSGRCFLLPQALLRRAWRLHGRDWVRMAAARHDGFRLVEAKNRGYVSRSVAVPIEDVLDAVRAASLVQLTT